MHLLLQKALYGLRRAPLAWYRQLTSTLFKMGFTQTSESTVMRYVRESTGEFILVLLYVDDILIAGSQQTIRWTVKQLEGKFQTKLTGDLPAKQSGVLEFLGREIRRESKDGPLMLSLPATYLDGVEETMGMPLTATRSVPKLSNLLKKDDHELESKQASLFRSALGKLAWFSLTMPHLSYQVSFLSCYQSSPTKVGWLALIETLKFAKSFRYFRQVFGSVGSSWYCPEDDKLFCLCDASWTIKSQMGAIILYRGSAIKAYSRRISSTCLSSAEAETFSIVEAAHECVGISLMAETFWNGLPKRLSNGEFVSVSGKMVSNIKTDSEAAKSIGGMFMTLLRRVRHLELRVFRLQELVALGRITLEYIQGVINPSDSLTKDSDQAHMDLLLECLGVEESFHEVEKAKTFVERALDGFGLLSGQNKKTIDRCT